jgi:hypothetical protein
VGEWRAVDAEDLLQVEACNVNELADDSIVRFLHLAYLIVSTKTHDHRGRWAPIRTWRFPTIRGAGSGSYTLRGRGAGRIRRTGPFRQPVKINSVRSFDRRLDGFATGREVLPTCFVIMPLSTPPHAVPAYESDDHFRHALAELHTPAIRRAGYDVIPPKVENSEVIQAEIIKHLATADLVVCDISTLNPNVIFELGICVALDRPVAMIKDDQTPVIPFDNSIVSCHTYDSRMLSWTVRKEIPRLAAWVQRAGEQKRNALWRHFGPDAQGLPTAQRAGGQTSSTSDFDTAVEKLIQLGGLARRRWDYDLGLDPPRRAVRLTLAAPPPGFLEKALLEGAAELGLTLEIAVRLVSRTARTARPEGPR